MDSCHWKQGWSFPSLPPLFNQRLYLINTSESGKALVARNQTLREKKKKKTLQSSRNDLWTFVWGNPFYIYLLILFRHIHIITQAHTINCKKGLYLNQITLLMLISPQLLLIALRKHTFLSNAVRRLPRVIATLNAGTTLLEHSPSSVRFTVFEDDRIVLRSLPHCHCESRREKAPHEGCTPSAGLTQQTQRLPDSV